MSEAPLKATLKAGAGYDDPWLTVDGTDPNDLKFKLTSLAEAGVLQALVDTASLLRAANNATPVTAPVDAGPAPQQSSGWGSAPAQPQQQAPQQQPQARPGDRPHPEGKTCTACNQVLIHKTTGSGKSTWRCPAWRWNNGNPNEHSQEWA